MGVLCISYILKAGKAAGLSSVLPYSVSCFMGSEKGPQRSQLFPKSWQSALTQIHTNSTQAFKNNVPIYLQLSPSLYDTQDFITHPSAQCWTLAPAARFNRRKLGMQNSPVVKGHVAPSASIQTMENLPVFSFYFLLTHTANNEALLWLCLPLPAPDSRWARMRTHHSTKFNTEQI